MQFGIPIDKRKALRLVEGTPWNGMLDLHRVALADWLPRNGESRALSVALRWLRATYPWLEWVQSYADATQCGDGAIYRACGFELVAIRPNTSMYRMPDGEVVCKVVLEPGFSPNAGDSSVKARYGKRGSETAGVFLRRIGADRLHGHQLRYVYFLDPSARERLTVEPIPYSEIARRGVGMYKGKPRKPSGEATPPQGEEGGSIPTSGLHSSI